MDYVIQFALMDTGQTTLMDYADWVVDLVLMEVRDTLTLVIQKNA